MSESMKTTLNELCQKDIATASDAELYTALLKLVQEQSQKQIKPVTGRKLYYISAEFLIGKLLSNNLINLGLYDDVRDTLAETGKTLADIEEQGVHPEVVLLDGNPLHLDPREINVVHGDARCASIAAASILAKVSRDALMVSYDAQYPGYDFASSKGYGSARHRVAIIEKGLTPLHRASFCQGFLQERLF